MDRDNFATRAGASGTEIPTGSPLDGVLTRLILFVLEMSFIVVSVGVLFSIGKWLLAS